MRTVLGVITAVAAMMLPSVAQARSLATGFTESSLPYLDEPDRQQVAARIRELRGTYARIAVEWNEVEPTQPPPASREDPDWSGRYWDKIDAAVRALAAQRVKAVLVVERAPAWAEGRGRPDGAMAGSWKPSASALGHFAATLAKRYSGKYTPLGAPTLPRVRHLQAWNEPNLTIYLTPQVDSKGGLVAAKMYRRLLNSFYTSVRRVAPKDVVLAASLAPFGDHPRIREHSPPVTFTHALLCLRRFARDRRSGCPATSRFDVYAQNVYSNRRPSAHARRSRDLYLADVGELRPLLRSAVSTGRALPRRSKPLWVTEFAWTTDPRDPWAVSPGRQARYLSQSLHLLWRQGIQTALWWRLRDSSTFGFQSSSGVYGRGSSVVADPPKPSVTAFRFPLVVVRSGNRHVAWGIAPAGGSIRIQRRDGNRWKTVRRLRPGARRVFNVRLQVSKKTAIRATGGGFTSLSYPAG